jgi:N-hydroxyarylamine O-acetyltransferase
MTAPPHRRAAASVTRQGLPRRDAGRPGALLASSRMDGRTLATYLERIGVAPPQRPDLEALGALQWGHVRSIPFENIDVLRGEPIRLELGALHDKLVTHRRGGYCFEHNTLLAAALRALGFGVTPLAARVRWQATGPAPRTHMLLAVAVPGRSSYLVDVGFGGQTLTAPLALALGSEAALRTDRYRLSEDLGGFVLQLALPAGWSDLYAFTLEPQLPIDYEVANHYTSTHPNSAFRRELRVALATPEGRISVRGDQLTRRCGARVERETIGDARQLLTVLARDFGLTFAPGAAPWGAVGARPAGSDS